MYVLMLCEVDETSGETTIDPVDDQAKVLEVGNRLGLGEPSDPCGWGVWYVER